MLRVRIAINMTVIIFFKHYTPNLLPFSIFVSFYSAIRYNDVDKTHETNIIGNAMHPKRMSNFYFFFFGKPPIPLAMPSNQTMEIYCNVANFLNYLNKPTAGRQDGRLTGKHSGGGTSCGVSLCCCCWVAWFCLDFPGKDKSRKLNVTVN